MAGGEEMERVRAPELPDSLEWVNCNIPPSVANAKGKVMLLHFWTYSNINSLNLLPDLRALENRYENGLVVVGIVCPKYPHEEEPANALKSINRLFLRYPVCVDADFELWQQYGVLAWPSVAVIDAEGYVRRVFKGDDMMRQLDKLVGELLDQARVLRGGPLDPAIGDRSPFRVDDSLAGGALFGEGRLLRPLRPEPVLEFAVFEHGGVVPHDGRRPADFGFADAVDRVARLVRPERRLLWIGDELCSRFSFLSHALCSGSAP